MLRFSLLIALITFMLTLSAGCVRNPHIADQAGKAFDSVFARQERNTGAVERPKAMEAELGQVATRQLVTNDKSAKTVGLAGTIK